MVDARPQESSEEPALAERVRQAEVRLSAQAAFIMAAQQRSAVFSGILLAISAGLVGAGWSLRPSPEAHAMAVMAAVMFLFFVVMVAGNCTHISLPGAVDGCPPGATKGQLLEALLQSYRTAAQFNAFRIFWTRVLLFLPFLSVLAAMGAGIADMYGYDLFPGANP